jgi:hypothetical protein
MRVIGGAKTSLHVLSEGVDYYFDDCSYFYDEELLMGIMDKDGKCIAYFRDWSLVRDMNG